MKRSTTLAIGIVLIVGGFLAYKYNQTLPGKYDDFAKCITEQGAKMYGAFWCPHCNNQKQLFGKSVKYIEYIECSLPDRQQTQICNNANIASYPTWEFKNKERQEGEITLEELSKKTGCKLP